MKSRIGKKIALICLLFLTTAVLLPAQSFAKSAKPSLDYYSGTIIREDAGTHFTVGVVNPVKGAKYRATVSNENVAQLVNARLDFYEGSIWFDFYAKKSGNVNITVKQTLKNKTTKVGTVKFRVKSKKFSTKEKNKEKRFKKVAKKGSDPRRLGVSLEVLKIYNVKKTGNKVSARVKFHHKVTADEAKLAGDKFSVVLDSKTSGIPLYGKLKKGSQYATVSIKKSKLMKNATKKGKTYYLTGLNTGKGSLYKLKVRF